jgi:hypothetical protein
MAEASPKKNNCKWLFKSHWLVRTGIEIVRTLFFSWCFSCFSRSHCWVVNATQRAKYLIQLFFMVRVSILHNWRADPGTYARNIRGNIIKLQPWWHIFRHRFEARYISVCLQVVLGKNGILIGLYSGFMWVQQFWYSTEVGSLSVLSECYESHLKITRPQKCYYREVVQVIIWLRLPAWTYKNLSSLVLKCIEASIVGLIGCHREYTTRLPGMKESQSSHV